MKLSMVTLLGFSNALLASKPPFDFPHETALATIGDHTYEYIRAESSDNEPYKGTIVLVHGFPDIAYGWHEQITLFNSLGYRVISPNMLGYGRSSRPNELEPYHTKNLAGDLATLIKSLVDASEQVIIGGHDWGANIVWNTVIRNEELFKAVIGLSVPYSGAPGPEFVDIADAFPNFAYQKQLRNPSFVDKTQGSDNIRYFLRGVYGGTTADGDPVLNATHGVNFDILPNVQPAELLPLNIEDFWVEAVGGPEETLAGPVHYYRTAKAQWEDDTELAESGGDFMINKPTFFACGLRDEFVPCAVAEGMEQLFTNIEIHEMDTGHWIQNEAPNDLGVLLRSFLNKVEGKGGC